MKALNRNYNMPDAELSAFASNLVINMTRDTVEFALRSVNSAAITALGVLQSAFELLPTDTYYLADVSIAVETKAEHRLEAEKLIRSIVNCGRIKWGEGSAQVRKFGAGNMTKDSDKVFLTTCRQVITTAEDYLSDLSSLGLTQDMIDDLEDLADSYAADLNNVAQAQAERDIKSQERITKGNELYDYVVRYCDIGKIIWIDVDEARYNDYIIYAPPASSLEAPQNLRFYFPNKTFYWDSVDNASNYRLESSSDGIDFTEIYSGSETECAYIPPVEGTMFYRCYAKNNSGAGPFSDILEQGYFAILPAPVNLAIEIMTGTTNTIILTWDPVPSATTYKVYKSTVIHGDPAGTYVIAGSESTNSFSGNVAENSRTYFRLTAESSNQWSGNSGSVFVEI